MAMTSWCEHCGAIHLVGPFIPQRERCTPEDYERPWPWVAVVSTWIGAIVGSWALVGLVVFGLLWAFQ